MVSLVHLPPLQEKLYREIQRALLDLEIRPGERIKIEELAQKLGVSRTPVREVFQRLKSEGLVRLVPRVGPIASEMSEKEVHDLFAVRMSLESLAVKQAMEKTNDRSLKRLQHILDLTKKEVASGDARKVRALNVKFHKSLYERCGNPVLIGYLDDIFVKLQRYLNLLPEEDAIRLSATRHHEHIVMCLQMKDERRIQEAVMEHLEFSETHLMELLKNKYSDWLKSAN
ncbi:MAG: GntR family transcriptional regulator [Deltaproteobacteria bacterium]|nr:GntR family transcriptional regulator [Deltaproteobacteria bacterium]